jgi:hypothetical protein
VTDHVAVWFADGNSMLSLPAPDQTVTVEHTEYVFHLKGPQREAYGHIFIMKDGQVAISKVRMPELVSGDNLTINVRAVWRPW